MNLLGFVCVMISAGLWRSSAVGFKVSNRQTCARSNSMKLASSSVPYKLNSFVLFSVQERLTKQIAIGISEALQPKGVAVVIEAA